MDGSGRVDDSDDVPNRTRVHGPAGGELR